jgi:hypothetical protein
MHDGVEVAVALSLHLPATLSLLCCPALVVSPIYYVVHWAVVTTRLVVVFII